MRLFLSLLKILNRILKILFFLCIVSQNFAQAQCVGSQSASMSPIGPYSAGQLVTVSYTLNNFIQLNNNWIIAFDIDYGSGWSSISPVSAPANPNTTSWPGTGNWTWDTQNTYPSAINFGPGYRFVNTAGVSSDWGSSSTGPFTLSFQLVVGNSCVNNDLSIDLNVLGDCQTGGWNNGSCCIDPAYSVYSGNSIPTSIAVLAAFDQSLCLGEIPNSLLSLGSTSGNNYSWTPASDFVNATNQNPVFSNAISTTTLYMVTFTDFNGCVATDSVTITVFPTLTTDPINHN